MVDMSRHAWLPESWGQGVKITNPTAHTRQDGQSSGGTYTVIIAPDGKVFYHRGPAEEYWGQPFTKEGGFSGQVRKAKLQAVQAVQLARMEIKEAGKKGAVKSSELIGTDTDASFFGACMTPSERRCLVKAEEFHFCVVSARRATKPEGVQDIFMVQSQFLEAGVSPTWYVDEASLADYKALGLKATVGGKLTEARNKCLIDANRLGKVCVQVSDDISAWEYREGKSATERTDDAVNAAHNAARRFIVSPLAAARFILAKMRSAPEQRKPHLGGLYMLGSCSRTFGSDAFGRNHFVIGDFFVVDKGSRVRFDESMRLKEDYDFACSHIKTYGSVMRCNRMTLNVKHYSNCGGAVAVRNSEEEKRNIAILNHKWPGVFRLNPKRRNEVIMRWKATSGDAEGEDFHEETSTSATPKRKNAIGKVSVKKTVTKSVKKSFADAKLPPNAVLSLTKKTPKAEYIAARVKKAAGLTVNRVLTDFYRAKDLRYDVKRGFLAV